MADFHPHRHRAIGSGVEPPVVRYHLYKNMSTIWTPNPQPFEPGPCLQHHARVPAECCRRYLHSHSQHVAPQRRFIGATGEGR